MEAAPAEAAVPKPKKASKANKIGRRPAPERSGGGGVVAEGFGPMLLALS